MTTASTATRKPPPAGAGSAATKKAAKPSPSLQQGATRSKIPATPPARSGLIARFMVALGLSGPSRPASKTKPRQAAQAKTAGPSALPPLQQSAAASLAHNRPAAAAAAPTQDPATQQLLAVLGFMLSAPGARVAMPHLSGIEGLVLVHGMKALSEVQPEVARAALRQLDVAYENVIEGPLMKLSERLDSSGTLSWLAAPPYSPAQSSAAPASRAAAQGATQEHGGLSVSEATLSTFAEIDERYLIESTNPKVQR